MLLTLVPTFLASNFNKVIFSFFLFISQQEVSIATPWPISFYFEEQLLSFRKAQLLNEMPCQLFIDATGSIIKPHGQKIIYVYSLSGATPILKLKSLWILKWISDRHNIATITNVLTT